MSHDSREFSAAQQRKLKIDIDAPSSRDSSWALASAHVVVPQIGHVAAPPSDTQLVIANLA